MNLKSLCIELAAALSSLDIKATLSVFSPIHHKHVQQPAPANAP